jgi:hypothetical protein
MSNVRHQPIPSEPTKDEILRRLLQCVDESEKGDLAIAAIRILGERCSLDSPWRRYSNEPLAEESQENSLGDRMMAAWPADWPTQCIVELNNVGDPGAWLSDVMGEPIEEVLFGSGDIESTAAGMAEDYLHEIREQSCPLPSDFGDEPSHEGWTDEDENQVRLEFVAFLRHWRERILQTLEKQSRKGGPS